MTSMVAMSDDALSGRHLTAETTKCVPPSSLSAPDGGPARARVLADDTPACSRTPTRGRRLGGGCAPTLSDLLLITF